MKRRYAFAGLLASVLALAAGAPASAQLYKWVDEHGVVNYSNQPPADPASAGKAAKVEDRVSVYSPDASLVREIEADRERRAAGEKPEAYRPAVAAIGGPAPAPAIAQEPVVIGHPIWIGGGFVQHRVRPLRRIPQIQLRPGAIAGNIVGVNGLIPGNTAPLFAVEPPAASRPAHRRPASLTRHRWDR